MKRQASIFIILFIIKNVFAQVQAPASTLHSDALHTAKPDYITPYGSPKIEEITAVLGRIRTYLDEVTPTKVINKNTKEEIKDYSKIDTNAAVYKGDFSLTSYEWGVTYAAMLAAGKATGDPLFTQYATQRINFLADLAPIIKSKFKISSSMPLRQVLAPHALDDCGAVSVSMIKSLRAGLVKGNVRPLIDNYLNFIYTKEYRLSDGTLARNRPLPNTLWLDDLFMGVPALAQMGKLTGDKKYFDDAVKQILQFSNRMFNKDLGLFMHGWVDSMETHPEFHWGRANGWAILTLVEVLDVLPKEYKGREEILALYKAHVKGLATQQSGFGFWHQLLDKNDSYLETSATAIYTYCIAKGINEGWLDATTYGPMALLGWNAVATKVNSKGQVEDVCVGTGMAFDPAFYYYRPVSVYAAHGYGPTLFAGAEIINLLKKFKFDLNDSATMLSK
jgi:unsaturated rhamnogalacturonyl hydrolase